MRICVNHINSLMYPDNEDSHYTPSAMTWFRTQIIPLIERTVLNLVFDYNIAKIRIRLAIQKARKSYFVVEYIFQFFEGIALFFWYAWVLFTRKYVESSEPIWISRFTHDSETGDVHSIRYRWKPLSGSQHSPEVADEFRQEYAKIYHDTSKYLANFNDDFVALLVGKYGNDAMVVRNVFPVVGRTNATDPDEIINEKIATRAFVEFFAVEYKSSPNDTEILTIEIPRSHYMVGNELLSKAYILRYLHYLPRYTSWKYTEDYEIKLVDDTLNEVRLNKDTYVRLEHDEYKVMPIVPDKVGGLSEEESKLDDLLNKIESVNDEVEVVPETEAKNSKKWNWPWVKESNKDSTKEPSSKEPSAKEKTA